jgi:hypothetical protein
MSIDLPLYVAGLGLVLLSLIGLLVVLRRARRAPEPVADPPAELVETPEPAVGTDDEVDPGVRALRAQVRVLEEALQRAADATVEQPELAAYRAQVRVAVEAVARRTPADADPRAAVARVGAAVARLDADPTGRVVLPAPPRRPAVVLPVVTEPVPEREPVEEPVALDVPAAVEPVQEEVVLPVPPPAPAEPRRSRRRLRRSAA